MKTSYSNQMLEQAKSQKTKEESMILNAGRNKDEIDFFTEKDTNL
jgi:hypothetical protein